MENNTTYKSGLDAAILAEKQPSTASGGDMNVNVCEHTPDAESLLLNNTAQSTTTEEKAETSISTVDSEFDRPSDQEELMFRRFIGLGDYLLTREGEIEIVKRIEGGLMDMMAAISASPAAVAEILVMANEAGSGKIEIWDFVDSFVDCESDYYATEEFTKMALSRFEAIAVEFERLHQAHAADGYGSPDYQRAQQALTQKLTTIRFIPKAIKKLRKIPRAQMIDARKKAQDLHRITVDKCNMSRRPIKFLPNLLDRKWIEQQAADKSWNSALKFSIPSVQELQQYLIDPQKKVAVPLDELKYINKRINDGERAIRNARTEMFEAKQPVVIFMAKKFINKSLSWNELIEVCNRYLRRSINRLAYCKNFRKKSSDIITWYMRQAMIEAIYNKTRCKRHHNSNR